MSGCTDGQINDVRLSQAARFTETDSPVLDLCSGIGADLIGCLAEQFSLTSPHPSWGLLTGAEPMNSRFLTPFERILNEAWSPKRIRRALRDLNAGIVEVKTRGGVVDPDMLARSLRGSGSTTHTLFALRFGTEQRAILTRRIDKSKLS